MSEVVVGGLSMAGAPGLAVARALRAAFADTVTLTGFHDLRCAAAHDPVFDGLVLDPDHGDDLAPPPRDACWLPANEHEHARFAALRANGRVLSPDPATAATALAALQRATGLPAPSTLSLSEDDWRLCSFCREHGWDVWMAADDGRRLHVDGWRSFLRLRARHVEDDGRWHLRASPTGALEAVAFAGCDGVSLGVHHMRRGAGAASMRITGAHETIPDVARAVVAMMATASWTGGGAVALIRTPNGGLSIDDVVPAFPDWVHALALAGANLPAALLAAVRDVPAASAETVTASEFVRVTIDVPVRCAPVRISEAQPLQQLPPSRPREPSGAPWRSVADLPNPSTTPFIHRLSPAARWSRIADAVRAAAPSGCEVRIAHSLKTDPHPLLLAAAREHGFLAEAITAHEAAAACAAGFEQRDLVLNGPAKRWPSTLAPRRAFAAFADSAHELEALARAIARGDFAARFVGPRVRAPRLSSRFGSALDDEHERRMVAASINQIPRGQAIGVHFHGSCSENGHARWFDALDAVVTEASRLGQLTGRPIACLDIGGGWFPDDFDAVLLPRLPSLVRAWRQRLPALSVVLLEPGKALSQPCAVVETAVIDLFERDGRRVAVVDASIAELPEANEYPHRILSRSANGWRPCGRGPDTLVGRLALEIDVLAFDVALPADLRAEDRLLIADAGAYDRSLSFQFGYGSND